MSMGRMLGFGFLFGAKDDGAVRMTDDISEGMDRVVDATERVGRESAGVGRLGNFINALNLRQLSRVGDAMESLADRAGVLQGEISTTSMESFGAEFAQTYRAATAGMGEFRAEVDAVRGEISGIAFNTGVAAEDMLSYATTVARAGMSLEDFGIEMRAVGGSIQAGILDGQQLANVLTGLARGYDLGADGARRVLDTVTALGTQFGVGADAARALPNVMEAVDQAASRFPSIGENVDVAIESMTRLGIASQQRLGGTFEEGIQSAINVFNELAGSRREMEGLFVGLNDQMPELAQEIARATGNVSLSFDAIMQDPARFAGTIANMFNTMDQDSPAAVRLRAILQSMGDDFLFLVQGGEESSRALQAAMGTVDDVEGAFNNMSRAAGGSSRTFAESMELIEEGFRARLDRMARRHYPNFERNVLRRQREAYRVMGDTIDDLSESSVGGLVRSMIAFRRGGFTGLVEGLSQEFSGLGTRISSLAERAERANPVFGGMFARLIRGARDSLPFLDAAGAAIFDMAGQALPAATAMGALGLRTQHLTRAVRALTVTLSPLVIAIGAIAGIYLLIRYFDEITDAVHGASESFRDFGANFLARVQEIDWAELGQSIVQGLISMFTGIQIGDAQMNPMFAEIGANFRDGFRDIFLGLAHAVPEFLSGIWEVISEYLGDTNRIRGAMSKRIGSIGEALGSVFGGGEFFSSLFGGIGDVWAGVTGFLATVFNIDPIIEAIRSGNYGQAIIEAILGLGGGGFMRSIYEHLFGADAVSQATSGIAGIFGEIGAGIWDSISTWIDLVRPIVGDFMGMFSEIFGVFGELWDDTFQPLIEDILGIRFDAGDIAGGFESAQGIIRTFFVYFQNGLQVVIPLFRQFIQAWIPRIVAGVRMFADGVRVAVAVFRGIIGVVGPVIEFIVRGHINLGRVAVRVFTRVILPAARRVFRFLQRGMQLWWRIAQPIIQRFGTRFLEIFRTIMSTGRRVFNFLQRHITRRIEEAAVVFATLGARWEAAKAVLRAGFRVIAAEVNRWLVVPFVRLQGTLVGMADMVRMAFLRVKLGVLEMMESIIVGFQTLVRRLPGGNVIASALTPALENIQQRVAQVGGSEAQRRSGRYGGDIGRAASAIRAEQQRRQGVIDEANARADAAREAAARAVTEGQRRVQEAERSARAEMARRAAARAAPTRAEPERPTLVAEPEAPRPRAPAVPRRGEEEDVGAAVTRRRGAEEERRARETQQIAEAMAISEFNRTAREQMTAAFRAAMPRNGRQPRTRRAPPTPPATPR